MHWPIAPVLPVCTKLSLFYPMEIGVISNTIRKTNTVEVIDFMLSDSGWKIFKVMFKLFTFSIIGVDCNGLGAANNSADPTGGKTAFTVFDCFTG